MLHGFLKHVFEKLGNRARSSVSTVEGGLLWHRHKREGVVRWSEIKEVWAVKSDVFAISDLICVGIRIDDDGRCFEINELDPKWQEVVAALEQHLRFPASWKTKVMQTPVGRTVVLFGVRSNMKYISV